MGDFGLILYAPFARAKVTSLFGWRWLTRKNGTRFRNYHRGIDFAAAMGTAIMCAAAGVVFAKGFDPVIGYWVEILLADGRRIRYHMLIRPSPLARGARVAAGTIVGHVGMSGSSATGPHLHVEILVNGSPVDPLLAFTFSAIPAGGGSTPIEDGTMPTVVEIWTQPVTVNGETVAAIQVLADIRKDTAALRKAVAALPVDVWTKVDVKRAAPVSVLQDLANTGSGVARLEQAVAALGAIGSGGAPAQVDLEALADLIAQRVPVGATKEEVAEATVSAIGALFPQPKA